MANLLTLPADIFRSEEVGTASGLSGMGGSVGGILATLLTGYMVTRFSYTPMFIWAGLMHPLAFLLIWRLLPNTSFIQEPHASASHMRQIQSVTTIASMKTRAHPRILPAVCC